ncbi:MAG: RnfABCDGE type electron transport complex subunit C, partial [Alphaproteobacteria bacterium]|nr:RnfABCDGE type electron transport complex subunit C [Alphaproteobacteria bacterium]
PQGGEKQLIAAITKREVPSGKLPLDVGCIVQNVGTVFAVYEAVMKNKPLFERVVTVSGDTCKHPANYKVRIGTPISYLIEKAGGLAENTAQIILGGPMMGSSASNINAPITKLTSGVLMLSDDLTHKGDETDCIRCGKCAQVCPMGLEPFLIGRLMRGQHIEELKSTQVLDCIECGCCAYTCPARIPLLDYCKLAKIELKKKK